MLSCPNLVDESIVSATRVRLLAPFLFVTLTLSALSYRYIEFGRERNWQAVFLIPVRAKAAVSSQL